MADLLTVPVAIIGAGAISDAYVPALRAAGFAVEAACARPGSPRLSSFVERHGIPEAFEGVEALLAGRGRWDAVVVAPFIDVTASITEAVVRTGAVALMEKPGAVRSSDLDGLLAWSDRIMVAYNRRYYPGAFEAQRLLAERGPCMAQLVVPEAVIIPDGGPSPADTELFFTNSVHALDLALCIFGELEVEAVTRAQSRSGALSGIAALLSTARGDIVQFTGNWQAPSNFSLTLDWPGLRLDLRPLEVATCYEGMDVEEPTDERPLRLYRPRPVETLDIAPDEAGIKPGFLGQAKAFRAFVAGDADPQMARVADAKAVLQLAERLAGFSL